MYSIYLELGIYDVGHWVFLSWPIKQKKRPGKTQHKECPFLPFFVIWIVMDMGGRLSWEENLCRYYIGGFSSTSASEGLSHCLSLTARGLSENLQRWFLARWILCPPAVVLFVCLFLSYPYPPCPDNINNADTLCNFYWKLSGDLTKGKYSCRGKMVFIYLRVFLEKEL